MQRLRNLRYTICNRPIEFVRMKRLLFQSQCATLKQEIIDMKHSFDQTERRYEEEKTSEERKHNEEVTFLKKTNAQLKV